MDPMSLQHLLTHKPALDGCEACLRGKLREAKHYRGAFKRETRKWGDLVTCDHLVSRSEEVGQSVQKHSDALVVVDVHTRLKHCYPLQSKSAEETLKALRHFKGARHIELLYADNSREITEAANGLGVALDTAQPGVPQTNAIAERTNGDVLAMTRTAMVAGGFPACYWSWAAQCVCFNDNARCVNGTSAYYETHKQHAKAALFPFGCGVWFKPSPTAAALPKWDGRASWGVFAGYKLHHGYLWKGEYYVWDLDQFLGVVLASDMPPGKVPNLVPHVTRQVKMPEGGASFPLKSSYEFYNKTLSGRAAAWSEGAGEPRARLGPADPGVGPPALPQPSDEPPVLGEAGGQAGASC